MKSYGLTVRGIIKNDSDEILIVKRHPKSRTDPEMWELPGGKVEKGEHFADALVREIKEETNLDVNVGDFCEAVQNDSAKEQSSSTCRQTSRYRSTHPYFPYISAPLQA